MRTNRTSLIGRFMQSVRRLNVRLLVWLAVLSTTAILACKDDPMGPDGTGRLTITVVPYEDAQAAGSAASDAESSAEARQSTATNGDTARPPEPTPDDTLDLNVGPEKEAAKAARQTAAAPPRRDLLRVNLSGPTFRSETFVPNPDGSVDVTIESLPVGTYSVELLGLDTDTGVELVSEYGINNSVTVRSDLTSNAVISFGSFLPVIDPTLPAQTSEFSFVVDYTVIPSANGYFFELDTDASFPAPTTLSTTGTSVIISVDALGPNWMRVRAENNNVPATQAKPSDPILVDVVADINPTGDDNTTAPSLGVGRGANGQYANFNIFPATDEDWFAIDLTTDATLTVDVLTESLSPPPPAGAALEVISAASGASPLDPVVDIYDPSLTVIATNDDRDATGTVESRVSDVAIPVDGTYFIRVTSFLGGSVGHYELLINVDAPPDPARSTISGSPTSIPADGASTSTVTVQLADAFGNPLSGGGDAVTLATDLGAIGFVTDNGDGTYTAILTAGVTPGFATISGTVNTVALPTGIVTFRGTSPPDLIGSTHKPVSGGTTGNPISGPSALYSIDRITGAATPIGMIGFNRVGAMDVHPTTGVLYAAAERASDFTPVLITIDQTTGVGTEVGPTFSPGAITDLTFHSDGTLYGHDGTPGSHGLFTFDLATGAGTLVGNTGIGNGGNGLAFNATNSLFLAAGFELYALETATGSGPDLGPIFYSGPGCDRIKAVDRDPTSGLFYAALECTNDGLGTFDINTRTVTFIGSSVADLDGLVDPATSTAPTTGPASELFTTIGTFNNNIAADGVATAAIIVQATDATNTRLTVGGDHLSLSTTLGTLSAVTDNGDGTYTATLTSSTTVGTATVSGTLNGVAISSTQGITSIALLGSAHTSGGPATLYWIDPATGGAGILGAIGFDRVGAMAKHPTTGVFYAAAQRPAPDGTPVLITVDPVTGAGTEIGPTGVSGSVTDMSFHSNGTLYLFDGPSGGHNLHNVDLTTGAATLVGSTGLSGSGNAMWFDALDVLYVVSTTSLYSVSTSTASPSLVGAITYTGAACASPIMNAADYDPVSGNTYASVRCFAGPSITAFASVNVGTLIVNVIGGTVDRIDGLVTRR